MMQGVRSYDPAMGTWTTPDAYAGNASDPMSQRSYMWDRNNAFAYSDPSGFCADAGMELGMGSMEDASQSGENGSPSTSKKTPSVQECVKQALINGAITMGLDAIGFLPEGEDVAIGAKTLARQVGNLKGYRGIVADQVGRKVVTTVNKSAEKVANGVSLGRNIAKDDLVGAGMAALGLVPGWGQLMAAASLAYDAYQTQQAVYKCEHPSST